jgi:hypothetical protein
MLFLFIISSLFLPHSVLYRYMLIRLALLLWMLTVPQESMVRGSAAQTTDGKIRVRAPGFPSSVILLFVRP